MSSLSQFTGQQSYPYTQLVVTSSGTFVAPYTGKYTITAIGGGGGGGAASSTDNASAGGGSAGGLCTKTLTLPAGTSLTITIGAGGGRRTIVSNSSVANTGSNGTNTSVTGTGITLQAGGGLGGLANSTTVSNTSINAISGGTASGGDINITGGGVPSNTSSSNFALGGSSANIYGSFFSGIALVPNTTAAPSIWSGIGLSTDTSTTSPRFLVPYPSNTSLAIGVGGQSVNATTNATNGGIFAGGGPFSGAIANTNYYAGSGQYGGGGGGLAMDRGFGGSSNTGTYFSGSGGNGAVIIEFGGA